MVMIYNVDKLIYYEKFDSIELAIFREKQIKGYSRSKKDALINEINPEWDELLGKLLMTTFYISLIMCHLYIL